MSAVKAAFIEAANNQLQIVHAGLRYDRRGLKILSVTGWHNDDTPFAFISAPFHGDYHTRAQQITRDLIAAHTGEKPSMPAPAKIANLGPTLREALQAATQRAEQIGERAKDSIANLNAVIDTAEGVIKEVDAAAANIQQAIGASTNGGPGITE